MLTELTISNFAIVEKQSISFSPGFNVISGETGAGKSILLQALEFILGAKGVPSVIRQGAPQLEVEAHFDLSVIPERVRAELPEMAQGDELVVSRTLPREGRGKIFINGRIGTAALLEEIVGKLVNICSQHHNTRLLNARYHLELLDGFAGHTNLVLSYQEIFKEHQELERRIRFAEESRSRNLEQQAQLEEGVKELSAANPRAGLRQDLESELKKLGNAERIIQSGQNLQDALTGEEGVASQAKKLVPELVELSRLDPSADTFRQRAEYIQAELHDLERELTRYVQGVSVDEERLETLREELSELARLERRYRTDDAGLALLLTDYGSKLAGLSESEDLSALRTELSKVDQSLKQAGEALSASRKRAAKKLATTVESGLAELNMPDSRFVVSLTATAPTAIGCDAAKFMISANKGEEPRPLAEIASGGELSRVTLVVKRALRERSGVNVLVFDEVDTGASGGVARSVGGMLKELASDSQVVCITHLPQVASLADRHLLVTKEVGKRTVTVVRELSEEQKVDEIARMLAGYEVTDASRASARELIASNERRK